MAARIKKDDRVIVISGDHKGAVGKVLRVLREKQRVLVEGVNMVYRHVRRDRRNPQGGRLQKEAPIHVSNVQPVEPQTERGARVRFEVERDARGKVVSKHRVSVKTGAILGEVTRGTTKREGETV